MIDYRLIKELARQNGIARTELIALAPQNDPFYTGTPAEVEGAQWFTSLWRRFGFKDGVHLRRIHYRLVSQSPAIRMPNKAPYENTMNCWKYLTNAGKWARYLGLIDVEAFVDRRNPDAIIYAQHNPEGREPGFSLSDGSNDWGETFADQFPTLPALPELPPLPFRIRAWPEFVVSGYDMHPGYHVEVWAEKTTMNDVLIPLCEQYRVNLVTGAGEMSITAVMDFMRRVEWADVPARILYISDYDPAGVGMPISVARKIEFFQQDPEFRRLDIRLQPICLTQEQVNRYRLPRIPVKDSDRRKPGWEQSHGAGAVELDALEALRPGELARLVTAEIGNYYDPTLRTRAHEQRRRLEAELNELRQDALEAHGYNELAADYEALTLDFEETEKAFAELVTRFQPQIDAYADRLAELKARAVDIHAAVMDELNGVAVDMDAYQLPEPELPEESDDLLYDSRRGYIQQLGVYKGYRN